MVQPTRNINLVCTRHAELGACNSIELYKIIEYIQPDVIFEEISPQDYEQFYIDKARKNLETNTIYRYSQLNNINHVPVDTFSRPTKEFFRDHQYMMERVERLRDSNGYLYCNLIDSIMEHASHQGFKFLNSNVCSDAYEKMNIAIENAVHAINNESFFEILDSWKEIHEARENVMLQNIYDYSKANEYARAIFMIGASHRKSIIQKISALELSETFKLDWIYQLQ